MNDRAPWPLASDPHSPFPPAHTALHHPEGLLAIGGDLEPQRLLRAYAAGAFPWFNPGEPILWWSPDPRTVFDTASFQLSRGNRRALRGCRWRLCADSAFEAVITRCAQIPRPGQGGTWISPAMIAAYSRLHALGHAHSIEVHDQQGLVGGLYGVAIGHMFFAESMFSAQPGASKLALAAACRWLAGWQFPLLDAQVHNAHLALLGARQMPRADFLPAVQHLCQMPRAPGNWHRQAGWIDAASLLE